MLEPGKKYTRFNDKNERISFSFGEEVGEFLGIVPSGFLNFKLSGTRECIVNGGGYERLCDCGALIDPSYPDQQRTVMCESCLDDAQ
jgi:hypothetical protein